MFLDIDIWHFFFLIASGCQETSRVILYCFLFQCKDDELIRKLKDFARKAMVSSTNNKTEPKRATLSPATPATLE